MPSRDIIELTRFALTLAEKAAAEILPHFRANVPIDIKAAETWDPVTEGDRAGERVMRHLIEKHYPAHGIIGEEYGKRDGTSGLTWILDPVDGTRAFVIGLPTWATLIALYADGRPLLGVMNQPFVGDTFYGNPRAPGSGTAARSRSCASRPSAASPTAWAAPPLPISIKSVMPKDSSACVAR